MEVLRRREFCLLSSPRQGTDFLMDCVSPAGRYHREWFNPECNPRLRSVLAISFGDEVRPGAMFREPSRDEFEWALALWRGEGLNLAKENYSFAKAALFAGAMDVAYLFRGRRHTFPSSRPDFYEGIWDGLMMSSGGGLVGECRRYLSTRGELGSEARQVLAHSAAWVAQLGSAPAHVFRYDALMEMERGALEAEMRAGLPGWLEPELAAWMVWRGRRWDRAARERAYAECFESNSSEAEWEFHLFLSFASGLVPGLERVLA